jgi:hypothetical protein
VNAEHGTHVSTDLLDRYVLGDATLGAEAEWSIEAHLESCQRCRALLAAAVADRAPDVAALTDAAWAALAPRLAAHPPAPVRRRRAWLNTWASPATIPGILSATVVALVASALGRLLGSPGSGLSLALLAPMAPVLGVAAVWSRTFDPMYELVLATPRAGLFLLLRRTAAVLVAVVPLLAVASVLLGTSPLLWLLPSLACVLTSLALGSVIGVERAAAVVAVAWFFVVVGPALVRQRPPVATQPWHTLVFAGIAVVAAAVIVLRGGAFLRLAHGGGPAHNRTTPRMGL